MSLLEDTVQKSVRGGQNLSASRGEIPGAASSEAEVAIPNRHTHTHTPQIHINAWPPHRSSAQTHRSFP